MTERYKVFLPLIFTFVVILLLLLVTFLFFNDLNIDFKVILVANCLFFTISLFVFRIQHKAMKDPNPNIFIRTVMGGMMIKMGIVAAAVILYVLLNRKSFNKASVFIALLLYLIYLGVEVASVMKLNKQRNA